MIDVAYLGGGVVLGTVFGILRYYNKRWVGYIVLAVILAALLILAGGVAGSVDVSWDGAINLVLFLVLYWGSDYGTYSVMVKEMGSR